MKLSYDDMHKRVCIVVTDTIPDIVHYGPFVQRTLFEQKDSKWEFVPVKQWEERSSQHPADIRPVELSPMDPRRGHECAVRTGMLGPTEGDVAIRH